MTTLSPYQYSGNITAKPEKALATKLQSNGIDKKAAEKTAKEFEAMFLSSMMQNMFSGLEAEAPFGGGHSEKVYRSMMVGEYAKDLSAKGGIGLADHVMRAVLNAQEGK